MSDRFHHWGFLLTVFVFLIVGGCEPYMSMTDQMPAEARRTAALLPEQPRFVGMVDLQTVFEQMERSERFDLADSLQQPDHDRLRAFLDATKLDPRADLRSVYGVAGTDDSFGAIVLGNFSPEQVRRYLDRAPDGSGRAMEYRNAPLFQFSFGDEDMDVDSDTLTLAFLEEDLMAIAPEADLVRSMIDRHQDQSPSLADNEEYMRLVGRVGRGSTAWLVGRNMLETALKDTAVAETTETTVNRAGVQKALMEWSDRVLGLSEMPEMDRGTENRLERLNQRVREQALSLTWTDAAVDGQIFLTMRDEASASSVMQIAEGALAALRLSGDKLTDRQRDLLDEVSIEQEGALVHVQFTVDRALLQVEHRMEKNERVARREETSTRPARASLRRLRGIKSSFPTLRQSPKKRGGVQPIGG